ncbi:NADP-binding protein [Dacryopinax primogenitus]|uniref:NADP-binding protein n=1 Tax=Dacryopinax primogenitus (strain DJM 731) TaxID=1858805 RepID=M5GD15_DACPD|nr:NADP-binding protein [Dacryopinax primogenitus]EJU04177.1 NADP-binding protein [Dacryopinax primogenitus]
MPLPSVASFARPLTGRTVILTGGNVGLGFETEKHLAALGPARLIIACRSAAKGAQAVKEIEQAGKGKVGKVECWEVDQASFASVKAFCDRFEREGGGKLDLLVLNAGAALRERQETGDGWELMLQVNHLSTCLLAIRLLPFLSKAEADPPTPRVVILNSGLHLWVPDVPEADAATPSMLRLLSSKENCAEEGQMGNRYRLTKLFNVLFTFTLSERLPRTSALSVNTLDPGFCHSQLARNVPRTWSYWVFKQVLPRTTEMGSRTLVYTAVSKDLDGRSGEYSESCFISKSSVLSRSERGKTIRDKLWVSATEDRAV